LGNDDEVSAGAGEGAMLTGGDFARRNSASIAAIWLSNSSCTSTLSTVPSRIILLGDFTNGK